MSLQFLDGSTFCSGSIEYVSKPASAGERINRLFIRFELEGYRLDAVLDTGGAYLILAPEDAVLAGLAPEQGVGQDTLLIRSRRVTGDLHRVVIGIPASDGTGLQAEVTAFVPNEWNLPNFLGWHCCLEWFRFAIDPAAERFYFGSLR